MYQSMFNPYSPQNNIEKLKKQRDEIDNMINNYQQQVPQQPINNIINTSQAQTPSVNTIEWRVLNENEQVDNLYVNNKTLFVGDKNMVLKDVDGKLEKWNIEKTYPIDPKDARISELEKQIQELKGMIDNEHSKSNKSTNVEFKSDGDVDGYVKSKSKTNGRGVQDKT